MIQPHCRLRGVFAAARDAFLAELDKHTVGELAHPANELARLLGIVRMLVPAGAIVPRGIVRRAETLTRCPRECRSPADGPLSSKIKKMRICAQNSA